MPVPPTKQPCCFHLEPLTRLLQHHPLPRSPPISQPRGPHPTLPASTPAPQLCCSPPPALRHPLLIPLCFLWLTYYSPRHLNCVHCDYTEDTSTGPSSAILALWLQNQQMIRSLLFHKHKCHGSYSTAVLNSALTLKPMGVLCTKQILNSQGLSAL